MSTPSQQRKADDEARLRHIESVSSTPRWEDTGFAVKSTQGFAEARVSKIPLANGKFAWIVVDDAGETQEGQAQTFREAQLIADRRFANIIR